jgi:hypothetical protein
MNVQEAKHWPAARKRKLFLLSVLSLLPCPSNAWLSSHTRISPLETKVNRVNLYIPSSKTVPLQLIKHENESRLQMVASTGGREQSAAKDTNALIVNGDTNFRKSHLHMVTSGQQKKESKVAEQQPNGADTAMNKTAPAFVPDEQICRVVALPDGKLPTAKADLPDKILKPPRLLDKLDAIFTASQHEETRGLQYLERSTEKDISREEEQEENLVGILPTSLEEAGFELISRRDVDLCEALNAGYLLRLSIAPDVSAFDPAVGAEFYPEYIDKDGNPTDELLFEGRVLLYRRGYSAEVTEGRLLLPKLDYLQASIVQRSARSVTNVIGGVEKQIVSVFSTIRRRVNIVVRKQLAKVADNMPMASVAYFLRSQWGWKEVDLEAIRRDKADAAKTGFIKFSRYGGSSQSRFLGSPSSADALDPFLSCEFIQPVVNGGDAKDQFNTTEFHCMYDYENTNRSPQSLQEEILLERVSINNVVDLSTKEGRRTVVKRFFSKSKLVEPTFEEVIAIWRPLPEKSKKPKFVPPQFVYSIAEIFEFEDKLPKRQEPEPDPVPPQLEIRAYDGVPMANAPAVLPKTKLLFRPADAFVFDLISVLSFAAVLGSQRFDSQRLDILAIVSGTIWIIRTIIRYSNKLARYDLLVKTFLTSKIAHRNSGALKYITREAGHQRAIRAALDYLWLTEVLEMSPDGSIPRNKLVNEGSLGVNKILRNSACVRVDMDSALNDLVDLDLIGFSAYGDRLTYIRDEDTLVETLKKSWDKVFLTEGPVGRGEREVIA